MDRKSIPQPPQYWFCVLLDSVRQGDFSIARQADSRLRESGIEVSFRGLIPGGEPPRGESREVTR
jgi:hypothetical protein